MHTSTLDPAPRYLIRTIPEESALRCEICGVEILSSEEVVAAHASDADLIGLIEPAIVEHLEERHPEMFTTKPEIVFAHGDLVENDSPFPDQQINHDDTHRERKEAPPRSPDENDA